MAPVGSVKAGLLGGDVIPASEMDHFYWAPSLSSINLWPDEEGSNDATPNGAPGLVSSGINGNQSVEYDGTGDDHTTANPGALGAGDEYTFAVVFKLRSTSGFQSIFSNGSSAGGLGGYRFGADGTAEWEMQHTGVGGNGGGTPDTNPHVAVGTYDGSTMTMDVDGSQVLSATQSSPNAVQDQMTFAQRGDGAEYADVLIGAVGHEAAAADAARRDELTDLLAEPFGITTST